MGQTIIIKVPHAIVTLLMGPGQGGFPPLRCCITKNFYMKIPNLRVEPCQTLLLFFFFSCQTLNPATYLPVSQGTPSHSCEEMLEEVFSSRPDLRDIPLSQPGETYYTDRTGYLEQGHRKTGYAVTDAVVKAGRLPILVGSAELWALIRGPEIG